MIFAILDKNGKKSGKFIQVEIFRLTIAKGED